MPPFGLRPEYEVLGVVGEVVDTRGEGEDAGLGGSLGPDGAEDVEAVLVSDGEALVAEDVVDLALLEGLEVEREGPRGSDAPLGLLPDGDLQVDGLAGGLGQDEVRAGAAGLVVVGGPLETVREDDQVAAPRRRGVVQGEAGNRVAVGAGGGLRVDARDDRDVGAVGGDLQRPVGAGGETEDLRQDAVPGVHGPWGERAGLGREGPRVAAVGERVGHGLLVVVADLDAGLEGVRDDDGGDREGRRSGGGFQGPREEGRGIAGSTVDRRDDADHAPGRAGVGQDLEGACGDVHAPGRARPRETASCRREAGPAASSRWACPSCRRA